MMVKKTCRNCNKTFEVSLGEVKRGGGKYCSIKCYHQSPKKRKGKIIKCCFCGKEFYVMPYRLSCSKKYYCSRKCFQKGFKRISWNKGNRKYNGYCKNCGRFWRDFYPRKYCSQKCYLTSKEIKIRLKKHSFKKKYNTEEELRQSLLAGGRRCYQKHKKKRLIYYRELNRKRRGVQGKHTNKEWEKLKKKYSYICLCCKRKEPEITLTEDHIIPISKWNEWIKKYPEIKYQCDDIENIQPLCRKCNCRKFNKIIDYRP